MNVKHRRGTVPAIVATAVAMTTFVGQGMSSAGAASGCPIPRGSERLNLDPADFTTRITNPYWPMRPGYRWTYRETDAEGAKRKVVVTVTNKTKKIANGITARVVHDAVTAGGKPVEITNDYYAQDRCGNLWYLGEDTKEYENGKVVSTEGSFEAGVDGAQGGVALLANPRRGVSYRQEYYAGHAEDRAQVFSLNQKVEVPFGYFPRGKVLMTREVTPVEPKVLEFKFYVQGVGPVSAVGVSGGSDREDLLRFTKG